MSLVLAVGIVALIVALIIAIIVWTIVYIEYKKLVRQKRINWLFERLSERAEDSGNESEGDAEELAALGEVGPFVPGNLNIL
ncbi:vpu protein [Human immunodeficiency virus 1]|uniref:Protein Vpu n=1 Tax=Human immunodeficiency virus type 1 TaxID=11676 RepID=A0A1L4ANA7_HV1|nr:vpu protein [Human immunodeficiency virus 1]